MCSQRRPSLHYHDPTYTAAVDLLGPDSWTAQRLKHADSSHLHQTSRRYFIGPIPQGWLQSKHKAWYTHMLTVHEAPTFIATQVSAIPAGRTSKVPPGTPRPVSPASCLTNKGKPTASATSVKSQAVSFYTAHEPAPSSSVDVPRRPIDRNKRLASGGSFVTARSEPFNDNEDNDYDNERDNGSYDNEIFTTTSGSTGIIDLPHPSLAEVTSVPDTNMSELDGATSTASLLRGKNRTTVDILLSPDHSSSGHRLTLNTKFPAKSVRSKTNRVRFDTSHFSPKSTEMQLRARIVQSGRQRLTRTLTRRTLHNGQIVKMDKMLVRIDTTTGYERPEGEFDEKTSRSLDTRVVDKWREYMVICRETADQDATLTLQLYKTRVIPAVADPTQSKTRRKFKREIMLSRKNVKVNLFSSLDKTIVLWTLKRGRTQFIYLHPQSGTSAVEWYHFLREVLGFRRPPTIQVDVPALGVNIRLSNPFNHLVNSQDLAKAAEGDEDAIARATASEQAAAASVVDRCLAMLYMHPNWSSILDTYSRKHRLGLAWKRYDRLEWIHGGHERHMYGAMAMFKTHNLELRRKQHYPHSVETTKGGSLTEPSPIEGFLVRLTSRVGAHQKLGRLSYKRLYFTSHNQYLLFLRPAKAVPPKPPVLPEPGASSTPSPQQIQASIPLTYDVNPYSLKDDQIAWLDGTTTREEAVRHDAAASDEACRNAQSLLDCDGFINLCDCIRVRNMHRGATPADENVDPGSDVDFDENVADTRHDDGTTTEMDDDRTFEIVLRNELVIRLQAYSKATKIEWMRRLRDLIRYWTARQAADIELFKGVRQQNLKALNIDTRTEAYVGSNAEKWEVTNSRASSELYHLCGIASCRAIHTSGVLYRKPRMHSLFTRCHAILAHGHLLVFRDTLRSSTGKPQRQIHHDRVASIDLAQCYCYAGQITESDLLYENRSFDSNAPGSQSLPRVYLNDNWTSNDQDSMTTFVLWTSSRRGWFRSLETDDHVEPLTAEGSQQIGTKVQSRLRKVNQLGVKGKSIVFKARSRAERDHWVMGISAEIEKLQRSHRGGKQGVSSEVRLVESA